MLTSSSPRETEGAPREAGATPANEDQMLQEREQHDLTEDELEYVVAGGDGGPGNPGDNNGTR